MAFALPFGRRGYPVGNGGISDQTRGSLAEGPLFVDCTVAP